MIPIRINFLEKKGYNIFLQMAGKFLFSHHLYNLPFGVQEIVIKTTKNIFIQNFKLFRYFSNIFK